MKDIALLLPTSSQYEALHAFTHELYNAFIRLGAQARLILPEHALQELHDDPARLTICFNGAPRYTETLWLADKTNTPHLAWLLDPPYRFWELMHSKHIWIACDDLFSCEILRREDFHRYLFLPHGSPKEYAADPAEERPYAIVLIATFIDSDAIRKLWKQQHGVKLAKALEDGLDAVLADPQTPFIETLHSILQSAEPNIDPILKRSLFEEFEICLKGIERIELVKLLEPLGVHVFGGSMHKKTWGDVFKKKGVHIHPPISYLESLEVISKTKVLINCSIKNARGAHERIFSGTVGGALVVTHRNPWLQQELGDSFLYYEWPKRHALAGQVETFLKDPHRRITSVRLAANRVKEGHTWDHRAEKILAAFPQM